MSTELQLRKVITAHLLREGHDVRAVEYVLSNYDLTSYLLEDPLKIITEQVNRVSKAVEI